MWVADLVVGKETPPRAWGKLDVHGYGGGYVGNTPTCVGKTLFDTPPAYGVRKHPHVRGENEDADLQPEEGLETPPRAWGKPRRSKLDGGMRRNTPTCVGKTSAPAWRGWKRRKHPHVRGENFFAASMTSLLLETPPRAWGKLTVEPAPHHPAGNTPTCVGKTQTGVWTDDKSKKHPHVRGENPARGVTNKRTPETPPRAWGKPAQP